MRPADVPRSRPEEKARAGITHPDTGPSTVGLYKTKLIDLDSARRRTGSNEVERESAEWVRWFNEEQLHSSIDYCPPVEHEGMYHPII